jgi:hypothetical protein
MSATLPHSQALHPPPTLRAAFMIVAMVISSLSIVTLFLVASAVILAPASFVRAFSEGILFSHPPTIASSASASASALPSTSYMWDPSIYIPRGQPPNLPPLAAQGEAGSKPREIYGGKGDAKHLGGFTEFDSMGVCPTTWTKMITEYGINSVMDVGCGRGISARWFYEHNVSVLCVEGSRDAVAKSFLAPGNIINHDYSRGPWWPAETYDAVWSVEFVEHVSRQYHFNYISTFRKAALIFITSSTWGGWHHVEIHPDTWWIRKFESYGFRYSEDLTKETRSWAAQEHANLTLPDGSKPNPQHIWLSMKVFVNPAVAALPQHAHLFPRHGCFVSYATPGAPFTITRACQNTDGESALPDSYQPLAIKPEMHQQWVKIIKQGLTVKNKSSTKA